jgi:hypothetical protein
LEWPNGCICHALKIVGGGDTDVAVNKVGKLDSMSYISTGGGAFIQILEGKPKWVKETNLSHISIAINKVKDINRL